ncbi:glycosyltransferase family 2 protein [Halogeometricum borinquense]|uniref:glycosyltransferase family 2 protein n=1 Tax=Halogeometricum borinquense TaxID=60847 RepID=UPI001FD38060|nr:glycosyltransferase family 2 protein [Halogeometricum borinquense]
MSTEITRKGSQGDVRGASPPEVSEAHRSGDELLLDADSETEPVLSLVMPTLNEEEGIEECIGRMKNALEELQITGEIVVSDSSTDRTPEIAESMGAIVVEPDKPGYGYAYQYAFDHARGDAIAIGDADTTYDFEELPKLYELVANGDADMAMGSRLNGEIKDGAMPPLHQYVGNPLLTKFLNVFYGAGVSDAHSGMRVLSKEAWEQMECDSPGMEFASEMIMEAGARDLTIEERPITYHEREGEATLESFQDGWRHVRFMLVNAPGYLFSIPGILMSIVGAFVMLAAYTDVSIGATGFGPHSMVLGSFLVLVGYQVTSLGVFATVVGDPIKKPNDPFTNWLVQNVTLERGVTAGAILFGIGAAYAGVMVSQWALSGFTELPFLLGDIAALTGMILGLQMVFSAFFLSTANRC